VLAIARAFLFDDSRGHGTWNCIGHVWKNIPDLGIIDSTAIQQRGSSIHLLLKSIVQVI